jgi:hypothetical protein
MQRFEVVVTGEGLVRALAALNDAGIPTMGPAFSWRGGNPEAPTAGTVMFAVLEARSAEDAVARVRDVLDRADGEYAIERGVEFDPEDWASGRRGGASP